MLERQASDSHWICFEQKCIARRGIEPHYWAAGQHSGNSTQTLNGISGNEGKNFERERKFPGKDRAYHFPQTMWTKSQRASGDFWKVDRPAALSIKFLTLYNLWC